MRAVGKATARELAADVSKRIPDAHYEEFQHFVSPKIAVVESVMTGTPRGRTHFEVHIVNVLTLRNGKIAAKRSHRKATF